MSIDTAFFSYLNFIDVLIIELNYNNKIDTERQEVNDMSNL